jgi:outer membrane receptor protein involved in Fe transport
MRRTAGHGRITPHASVAAAVVWTLLLSCLGLAAASAAVPGKVQGKIVGTDTGEPIGFADVLLMPADTTLRKIGGMTNADGTFLLEAPAGRYTIQFRALSYATKRIEGVRIEAGKLLPFTTALEPEAIRQAEIVVEAKARQNTENSMLAARKKASAVGDAISAEQVRRSPDKDAAEVLRRVTGLSVSDGKYVFVRGLGERYSSTEVDGVRIASPEQNKRVVPLDLLPANLLENIVVQKTYTADRPGEFGGGDVQVHTKDFPGNRTWSYSITQGWAEGVTFRQRRTYASTRADIFGFGADGRRIPDAVRDVAGNRPLVESNDPSRGFPRATLAALARSFSDIWSPSSVRAIPNAAYSASYGDEFKLFGRPLGLIESWNLSRSFDEEAESQRTFANASDTIISYAVRKSTESVQLGGLSALSYRLSPSHTLHLRGLYTHSADDEVRTYEGNNYTGPTQLTGEPQLLRSTRLMYVERQILSGTLEGQHEFARLLGSSLSWKLTRSKATRLQPDRRETVYGHNYYYDGSGGLVGYWAMGPVGTREYGDLRDNGWGATISGALPYRLGRLGAGKVLIGFDRQNKNRDNFYRRFSIVSRQDVDNTAPPESVLASPDFVTENTFAVDNYRAHQRVTAAFTSLDVPFGRRARGNFGVRLEQGVQDVRSYDLFKPSILTAAGRLDDTDWLPSGNVTWAVTEAINLRMGASRTLSRPDINELSPSATTEFIGGLQRVGNPNLRRAVIENYDVRLEAFPALSEVLAAGAFYKRLDEPIEQAIRGGSPGLLIPVNSEGGHNQGVELEARLGLRRFSDRLSPFSLNANASFISSEIELKPGDSRFGSGTHPLQGQADYLVNGAATYAAPKGGFEATVLLSATGKRLRALGSTNLPDIYERPSTSLDATLNVALGHSRLKLAARNLLDPNIQQLQNGMEVSGYRRGRTYSIAFSSGS